MARPRVRLVITADDFGYCPRRDEGIVEAFLAGAVTSVSLLVNGVAAESAAELAGRHQIPTGLHANLSEGRPVGPARHGASSLLSPEGFFLGKMGFREAVAAGDIALPQVREELEAQLIRFRELLGGEPTHVDGHQHVHVLPGVCQVFAETLQANGVRFTRLPVERGVGGCAWLEAPAHAFACAVERDARAAVGPFSRYGLRGRSKEVLQAYSNFSRRNSLLQKWDPGLLTRPGDVCVPCHCGSCVLDQGDAGSSWEHRALPHSGVWKGRLNNDLVSPS
ncbi:carbohydrate deacetylase isoform X2 [Neovison vison]|uniref:carbohydrate deacetylase isoform X2 n=1 Tax=Neovison vison TaxID=452646 RepID=UPI001CF03900|nr:carbohydrate deacetylase isoform X2 [Neogale vison]